MTPDDLCARRAARNHQILHRAEALACGHSPRAIARRLEHGRWQVVYPCVYHVGPGSIPWKSRVAAACVWAGEGAVASHATAAHLLHMGAPTGPISITSARRINSDHGIEVHFDPSMADERKVQAEGISVTPPDRTILDLCSALSRKEAVALVERAVRRGRVSLDALARRVERGQGADARRARGAPALAWVLCNRFAKGVTDSELESMFIKFARRYRLPAVHHHVVYDGARRIAELDFAYVEERINVEVDGDAFHADAVSSGADKWRDAKLAALGWVVIRVTYWQLVSAPTEVFDRIRRAVETRRTEDRALLFSIEDAERPRS